MLNECTLGQIVTIVIIDTNSTKKHVEEGVIMQIEKNKIKVNTRYGDFKFGESLKANQKHCILQLFFDKQEAIINALFHNLQVGQKVGIYECHFYSKSVSEGIIVSKTKSKIVVEVDDNIITFNKSNKAKNNIWLGYYQLFEDVKSADDYVRKELNKMSLIEDIKRQLIDKDYDTLIKIQTMLG